MDVAAIHCRAVHILRPLILDHLLLCHLHIDLTRVIAFVKDSDLVHPVLPVPKRDADDKQHDRDHDDENDHNEEDPLPRIEISVSHALKEVTIVIYGD